MNYMDIPGHTFEEECKIIQRLVKTLPSNPFIVEIGTGAGRVTIAMMEALHQAVMGGHIVSVDNYSELNKYNSPGWDYESADRNITHAAFTDCYELINQDSLKVAQRFKESSIDMVYIDGSHKYKDVWNDINSWIEKLKPGGILAGHDWQPHSSDGRNVIRAISELLFTDPNIKFHVERQVWWMIK